jgi:hypothetical protein
MKARNRLASRNFVAELIRCTNDHSAMFTLAIGSRFSPPEFPNVWSAVSFCSYHASVLHKSSFLCRKFGKLPAGLAGTIQAQIVDGMAKTATNRGKLLLSCGDVQQCAVTPELQDKRRRKQSSLGCRFSIICATPTTRP